MADSNPQADSNVLASPVTGVDFVAVPSTDWKRSRAFYVDTLGLRPDETGESEFWIGNTCFGIYEPSQYGMEFAPQKNAHIAMHVEDVAAARAELESRGVQFEGEIFDTGVTADNNLSISGGNDRTTFYASGGLTAQNGYIKGPNNKYNRGSVRLKASHQVNSKFNIGGNFNFIDTRGNYVQKGSNVSGLFLGALRTPPNFSLMRSRRIS